MARITWDRLGPREKQILAILREADGPRSTRAVLERLNAGGEELAYTTVSTILERLAEKGAVSRDQESGSRGRYCYRFDPAEHREVLVEDVIEDVAVVLGETGVDLLVRRATQSQRNDRQATDRERDQ